MAKRKAKSQGRARPSGAATPVTKWDTLRRLISEYVDAAIAESWKGGGDPAEMPLLEAREQLAKAQLEVHIHRMERDEND